MEMGRGYLLIIGWVLLVSGGGMFLFNAIKAVFSPFVGRIMGTTWALAALYPLGLGFKAAVIGPAFLRYHLSDIGFAVAIGYIIYYHSEVKSKPENELGTAAQALRLRMKTLVIAYVLSWAYEAFIAALFVLKPSMKGNVPVGDFDWNDIVGYTVGAALCYLLFRTLHREVCLAQEYEADEKATIQEARRRRRPQPKKRRPKGKRR
jgi:hypothetical protein